MMRDFACPRSPRNTMWWPGEDRVLDLGHDGLVVADDAVRGCARRCASLVRRLRRISSRTGRPGIPLVSARRPCRACSINRVLPRPKRRAHYTRGLSESKSSRAQLDRRNGPCWPHRTIATMLGRMRRPLADDLRPVRLPRVLHARRARGREPRPARRRRAEGVRAPASSAGRDRRRRRRSVAEPGARRFARYVERHRGSADARGPSRSWSRAASG